MQSHFTCVFRTVLPAMIFLLGGLSVAAQEAAVTEPMARIQAAAAYLNGLPAYGVSISMALKLVREGGEGEGVVLKGQLAMAGTDRARFRVVAPDETMELYASGDKVVLHLVDQKQFVDGSVLGPRNRALTAMPSGPFRGAQMILSDFLHEDASFQKSLNEAVVERRDTAPLPEAEQFHVDGGGIACDFWIATGAQPRLLKFSLDLSELASRGTQRFSEAAVEYTFSDWNVAPAFPEDYFDFVIPEGVTELEVPQSEKPDDPMIGNPAPAIDLPLLDGGRLNLAEHKGKNVVILDFWASWCGPCRVGLPIVNRVAEEFRDKGVVFYAVNVGEDKPTAQAFLEQTGITTTVALDTDRVAQQAYQADGIPKTVIVDKDGIVRDAHAGVGPRLEQELNALLRTLTE